MGRPRKKPDLTPLDVIFGVDKPTEKNETVQQIALSMLYPFRNHPYHVRDDESMMELVESIRQNGVLYPAIARSRAEGGYELISGHRRKRACELAGLDTMPVDTKDIDDDTATLMMIGTNCQREKILPSEKAFAYKMMMEAMKRQAGRPRGNASQLGTQIRSDKMLEEQLGESRNQIQRYIRLTELVPGLFAMVDEGKLPFNTGVELSFLKQDEQQIVFGIVESSGLKPTMAQATQLKGFSQSGELTEEMISLLIISSKAGVAAKVSIPSAELRKYFPQTYTPQQMHETILSLLEKWAKSNHLSE